MCAQIKAVLFWEVVVYHCYIARVPSVSTLEERASDCEVNESFIPWLWLEITTAREGPGTESSKFTRFLAQLSKHKRFIG